MSFCQKLHQYLSNPMIFQTINHVRSSTQILKYRRFTPSGCKDKVIRKYEFVAKTQFLYLQSHL